MWSVGSSGALIRQLAARKRGPDSKRPVLVLFDGDCRKTFSKMKTTFIKDLECSTDAEKDIARTWFDQHVSFLPGDDWPERSILQHLLTCPDKFDSEFEVGSSQESTNYIQTAIRAGKHAEFRKLCALLQLTEEDCRGRCMRLYAANSTTTKSVIDRVGQSFP
jgi:hypothetical protein